MKMLVEVEKIHVTKCVYFVEAETIEEAQEMVLDEKVSPIEETPIPGYYFDNFCVEAFC